VARPARAEHDDDLTLLDPQRQTLQRSGVPLRRQVDAEDVLDLDRAHRNALRVASVTSPAAHARYAASPTRTSGQSMLSTSGGSGSRPVAGTSTAPTTG